ncbi:MAG: ATP-grasp domain-containing protein [Pelovirga sp.]
MNVALVFNLREESVADDEPPAEPPGSSATDIYAEWDDIHTISAISDALATRHRVTRINADLDAFAKLRSLRPDLVFNIAEGLHGSSREAQIPAMLEMLQIPYTGSDPVTLGLCLDKQRTKEILKQHRIPTPRFWTLSSVFAIPRNLRYPLIVKPCLEGSSKGVTDSALVRDRKALVRQIEWIATTYGQKAIIEEFLPGREFTVALLGNGSDLQVLPIVEIDFSTLPAGANPIYSYEAKWLWDTEKEPLEIFSCPAPLEPFLQQQIEHLCRRAFHALGCRDWCRIDVRLDRAGRPQIIEMNPLPGILPRPEQNSCFPKAARAAGLSYTDLVLRVVETASQRCQLVGERQDESRCLL